MSELKLYWKLKEECGRNYWEQRILAELEFLRNLFEEEDQAMPEQFCRTADELYGKLKTRGGLVERDVKEAEEALSAYHDRAKQYHVTCAAHAHIDMNWMWGMPETVGVVIDTFQTMLNLLEEYPDFIFSQSQASTYEIIEKYAPSMLSEIRKRVQEGRWEVTASSWVEADKNLTGTEAMIRHILYTKEYLKGLLGIDPDSIQVDFEPDTFGHSRYVPEILSHGGIKYYFHCRGNDQEEIYRWRVPSGKEVLVYREPNWYLGPVEYEMTSYVPGFCKRNHTMEALYVYGVGDHGGGPTRRDLERIMDMREWPLLPDIRFGRYHDYFQALEKNREEYPVVERELNYIFTGCYTTQSRIKNANRTAEDSFYDSEALGAMEYLCGESRSNRDGLLKGWRNIMFNQFHDILPGSCVDDTVSYSLGISQEAMSYGIACANRSMKAVGDQIDTSAMGYPDGRDSTSEGAGVGYNTMGTPMRSGQAASDGRKITEACRGKGNIRVYTLFNTTQYTRRETVEITLWDWQPSLCRTRVTDGEGKTVAFEVTKKDQSYWQHSFHKLLFTAQVPPFGYANYYIVEDELPVREPKTDEPRVHRMEDGVYMLENQKVRAVFDTGSMKLVSLTDKQNQKEMLDAPSGYFRYILEEDSQGYSAWVVGAYRKIEDLNEECAIRILDQKSSGIRQWITYQMDFHHSSLVVKVILDDQARMLRYKIQADWHETGTPGGMTPQLQFYMPFGYVSEKTRYDVPGGAVERESAGHDVPAVYYGAPLPVEEGSCLMLTSDSKYGYRTDKQAILINLLRAAYTPDRYPDQGFHHWELGVGVLPSSDWCEMMSQAMCFSHPLYAYSNSVHPGTFGQSFSFLKVDGQVKVAALKETEDGDGLLLRYYNCSEKEEQLEVESAGGWKEVSRSDAMENSGEKLADQGNVLTVWQAASSLDCVKILYR